MRGLSRQHQALYHWMLRQRGVSLGTGTYVARGSQMAAAISIGDHTRVDASARLVGEAPITIGKYCAIATGVTMLSDNHDMRTPNMSIGLAQYLNIGDPRLASPICVRNSVWIGDRAIVLTGVTIGDGAVIGAGSVVTRDVPAFAVAAGVPSRVLRSRFSTEVVEFLQELAWWDWDRARIERNKELMATDLTLTPVKRLSEMVRA